MLVRPTVLTTAAVAALVLAACGRVSSDAAQAPVPAPAAGDCPDVVTQTLGAVAQRIYAQAAGGRNVVDAVGRLQRSPALAAAVAAGDAAATRAALQPLLKHQITHIRIEAGSRVLVDEGARSVMAPTAADLHDARGRVVGHFLLTVTGPAAYAGITSRVTGAQVLVRSGTRQLAGTLDPGPATVPRSGTITYRGASYRVLSLDGDAYPSGPLRISLLLPSAALRTCGASGAETQAATLGAVAVRLFQAERSGTRVQAALRYVTRDRAYLRATAGTSPAAVHAAVRGTIFPRRQFHIVRVRYQRGRRAFDVGGPYALAPASRPLPGGGTVTLAVQDDTGYIKLLSRFTGGAVVLRMGSRTVPGSSLDPGPAAIPASGVVTYAGRRYQAFGFTAQAFPSGPLRVGLFIPAA